MPSVVLSHLGLRVYMAARVRNADGNVNTVEAWYPSVLEPSKYDYYREEVSKSAKVNEQRKKEEENETLCPGEKSQRVTTYASQQPRMLTILSIQSTSKYVT